MADSVLVWYALSVRYISKDSSKDCVNRGIFVGVRRDRKHKKSCSPLSVVDRFSVHFWGLITLDLKCRFCSCLMRCKDKIDPCKVVKKACKWENICRSYAIYKKKSCSPLSVAERHFGPFSGTCNSGSFGPILFLFKSFKRDTDLYKVVKTACKSDTICRS